MDIDPPARSTPPLADDSSNTSLTTALSTAPTSEERPVTAIDLATQARERVKAKKAAAAAALEAARLATAAPAAIVVPEVREENGNESSELSALDEPEEAMRPRRVRSQRTPNPVVDDPDDDDLDLPATADPYVAARAKSRAGTVTATDDDGPGAAKRRTTRQADLEEARMQKAAEVEERQVKKTKKLAALSGGKYSLASLKRDREKTDKLAASNLANASKVQAILEGPVRRTLLPSLTVFDQLPRTRISTPRQRRTNKAPSRTRWTTSPTTRGSAKRTAGTRQSTWSGRR